MKLNSEQQSCELEKFLEASPVIVPRARGKILHAADIYPEKRAPEEIWAWAFTRHTPLFNISSTNERRPMRKSENVDD